MSNCSVQRCCLRDTQSRIRASAAHFILTLQMLIMKSDYIELLNVTYCYIFITTTTLIYSSIPQRIHIIAQYP